jgi:hypothetical protein
MNFYLPLLVNILEFIAFVIVIYKRREIYNSSLRLLLAVIPFIFLSETIAFIKLHFFSEGFEQRRNFTYYNITTIIILLLYFALYYENIKVQKYRRIFSITCILTLIFYLINVFYIQTGQTFHTYSFTIGSVCLCLGIVFYTKEIIENDKVTVVSKEPLIDWIICFLYHQHTIYGNV